MDKFINISTSKGTTEVPKQNEFLMHMHDIYEIFCFIEGDAKYIVEGSIYPLHKGDLVLMRPSESHHILFTSEAEYSRIAINFAPSSGDRLTQKLLAPFNDRPLGVLNHYSAARFSDSHIFHYADEICRTEDDTLRASYLTVLLCELYPQFERLKQSPASAEKNIFSDIIEYINLNLKEELSLSLLCERFYISKSQLNRSFKRIIGSTVWEYITNKRLLLAKKLLEEGVGPTKVFLSCGFNDYTAFYRAYRAKFGCPPSETSRSAK